MRLDPAFEAGVPRPLFSPVLKGTGGGPGRGYAVTADGQRFLVNMPVDEGTSPPITLVQNWTALLKR